MILEDLKNTVEEVKNRLSALKEYLKIDEQKKLKQDIEQKMLAPDFWDDKDSAQETMSKLGAIKNIVESYEKLQKKSNDFYAIYELALEENGDETILEEARIFWESFSKELEKAELLSFLSGKYDRNNAYLSIQAGAGGTESCDWTAMLLRMYRRWIEMKNWKEEIIDFQPGDETGIKSVTIFIKGEFAFGYSKAEKGIHRLVRISPFDSNSRRHTSFASVEVIPEINDYEGEIEVEDKDLRIDTFRSSGAGGQHVNTTDSAVRIKHYPTDIIVSCQAERSQHKNRDRALKILKAKLYALKEEERKKETENYSGEKTEMGWGNHIRSYVLHPYQKVKDLRTNVETGNTSAVLDGDIDQFINAWLKKN